MKVLVACEESQRVCEAFREKGIEAYSCDLVECSGGHPEWHIQGDVLPLINGNCEFETVDGVKHKVEERWDLIIAHPPCTRLCNSGQRWLHWGTEEYKEKKRKEKKRKKLSNFSCSLSMLIVNILPSRIQAELCQHIIKSLIIHITPMILLAKLNVRKLVYGSKVCLH